MRRTSKFRPQIVYITVPNKKEALLLSTLLLEEKLVACINILPSSLSSYRWKGTIVSSKEYVLLGKTNAGCAAAIKRTVKKAHSYDCPCIVFLPIVDGEASYLRWIESETE